MTVIEQKIKSAGILTLKKKKDKVKYSKLGRCVERFGFLATTELTKFPTTIEVDEYQKTCR